ncbi:MAG: hypothetical protein EU547_05365 [Promethearchaeota archaeon]|nr:MAG: hypothetical protein EU547_05365 [Candidatus Lokiarchaeota archaeon]
MIITIYIVEEFWIVNFNGIPLYSYSPEKELEPSLISSFFSAIQNFSSQMNGKKNLYINSLTVGDSIFNFLINKDYELYFILKSSDKIKSKLINKHLKEIEKMFIAKFNDELESFRGEVTMFTQFTPIFKSYFQDKFIKLKSMW